jgi:hypothetical protein
MNVATIGLESDVQKEIERLVDDRTIKFLHHPVPPKIYTSEGVAYVAHPNIMDYYVPTDFVVWYSYFEDPELPKQTATSRLSRMALAMSNAMTFPNIKSALPFDDKMMALVLANAVGCYPSVNRGFFPPNQPITTGPNMVLKWGNLHCGEGKQLLVTGDEPLTSQFETVLAEPFVKGTSYRILLVGDYHCQLKYTSEDWRKNVGGKIEICPKVDFIMGARARDISDYYRLDVIGVDFVYPDDGGAPTLLEVNTYPSLEQDPSAKNKFCQLAAGIIYDFSV